MKMFPIIFLFTLSGLQVNPQSRKLTAENIDNAISDFSRNLNKATYRPAFHLTPPAGCMGDPNGGIFHDGWYHIFYGLHPFAFHPGGWYWAHARSRDLVNWERMQTGLTPAFELGLDAIGSGSTIVIKEGKKLAFYSQSKDGAMQFWRAEFQNEELSKWTHKGKNPVLTLKHPGLPPFDGFWRDPFVFSTKGRTFLIACADLFDEDYVPVPIFEATNTDLTDWDYKGILFTLPKHKFRNLEVPELRQIGDKWIFLASTDAPVDRVNYFLGDFDTEKLKFTIKSEGIIDYSGHYYAQETLTDPQGNLFLMSWIPGWDREWLPYYMNLPLKNRNPLWNGCFAIPRKLSLINDRLIQQPVEALKKLRTEHYRLDSKPLPVKDAITAIEVLKEVKGDQLEIILTFNLKHASFCGITVLADKNGHGGLPIVWSGNLLNVDGVMVPLDDWKQGEPLQLQIFVDKKIVEVFVQGGKYCVSRMVMEENVKGDHIALTSLGGTAEMVSMEAWTLNCDFCD